MGIEGAYLSPHPPIIISEIGGERCSEVADTIKSMEEMADEIKSIEPDLLITVSPHGSVLRDAISVLDKQELTGDFAEFGKPDISFQETANKEFIEKLKNAADRQGIDLSLYSELKKAGYSVSSELDHGVMVPLYFLKKSGIDVPMIPITMGLLSYEKLFKFGQIIKKVVEKEKIKAVMIASGDLSHRLKPGAPAGYNPRGKEFDEKLIELLHDKKFKEILQMDMSLIKKAGECGLRPVIIMLGSISGKKIKVDLKSYEGPFGVGYAVVGFYDDVKEE